MTQNKVRATSNLTYIAAEGSGAEVEAFYKNINGTDSEPETGVFVNSSFPLKRVIVQSSGSKLTKSTVNKAWDELFSVTAENNTIVMQILDYALKTYPVDESRIYLTGFSMGGVMSGFVGLQNTDKIAAIAIMGSQAIMMITL